MAEKEASEMWDFFKRSLSENGEPSSSRLTMFFFAVTCVVVIFVHLIRDRLLPTPGDWIAMGSFTVSPYTINQIRSVMEARATAASNTSIAEAQSRTAVAEAKK